jgi:hypothetical protein
MEFVPTSIAAKVLTSEVMGCFREINDKPKFVSLRPCGTQTYKFGNLFCASIKAMVNENLQE